MDKNRRKIFLLDMCCTVYLTPFACIQNKIYFFLYAYWVIKMKCPVVKVLIALGSIFNWVTADYVWALFLSLSHCLLIYPSLFGRNEELLTDYLSCILFYYHHSLCLYPLSNNIFRRFCASSLMDIKRRKVVVLVCMMFSEHRCLRKL